MTVIGQIYKCSICGNMVEVLHSGAGELVCCGQPMNLLEPKIHNEGEEKHLPVVEKTDNGFQVKIGAVDHPMEENHFIEWIGIKIDGKRGRKFLQPGEPARAEFFHQITDIAQVKAQAYCNVHGLWQNT